MTDDRYRITGDVVLDTTTGLEWQHEHAGPMTWVEAAKYAAKLGDGWRLPTVSELVTLVDYERHTPASAFPAMPVASFWSSSSYAGSASYAWFVDFYSGYVYRGAKARTSYVRCVRRRRGGFESSDLGSLREDGTTAVNDCADLRAAHRRAHADAVAVLRLREGLLAIADRLCIEEEQKDRSGYSIGDILRNLLAGRSWDGTGEVT